MLDLFDRTVVSLKGASKSQRDGDNSRFGVLRFQDFRACGVVCLGLEPINSNFKP